MSGTQQRAAFRRFASGTPGGTGLGLAIVNRLVLANGGSAAMSDTPGGGLTVIIDLPLADSHRSFRRPGALSAGSAGDLNRF
jgi:signal transduction histidine kinase